MVAYKIWYFNDDRDSLNLKKRIIYNALDNTCMNLYWNPGLCKYQYNEDDFLFQILFLSNVITSRDMWKFNLKLRVVIANTLTSICCVMEKIAKKNVASIQIQKVATYD